MPCNNGVFIAGPASVLPSRGFLGTGLRGFQVLLAPNLAQEQRDRKDRSACGEQSPSCLRQRPGMSRRDELCHQRGMSFLIGDSGGGGGVEVKSCTLRLGGASTYYCCYYYHDCYYFYFYISISVSFLFLLFLSFLFVF